MFFEYFISPNNNINIKANSYVSDSSYGNKMFRFICSSSCHCFLIIPNFVFHRHTMNFLLVFQAHLRNSKAKYESNS